MRVEPADLVVVGVGVAPRVELATAAGLDVDNGVVVDEQLAGERTRRLRRRRHRLGLAPALPAPLRVEHWANALNQGTTAGGNAAVGREVYDRLPYFFSDQYDLGMEYVGHADPDDKVVSGAAPPQTQFPSFWPPEAKAVPPAMTVNVRDASVYIKSIIMAPVDPPDLSPPPLSLSRLGARLERGPARRPGTP